jgi:single-strand DNA-binding protein
MVSLNRITVIGNLGADPEMRYTAQGVAVTNFRVAVNHYYNDTTGERQQDTQWFRVEAWRQLAELCNQYLGKGRRAYVEGRFRSREWQGTDGQTRTSNEIVADRVLFLDRPGGTDPGTETPDVDSNMTDPDDLPF